MKKAIGLSLVIILILTLTGCMGISINIGEELAEVGELEEFSHKIPLGNERNLEVDLRINAAKAVIGSTQNNLFEGSFLYNVAKLKPNVDYNRGKLKVSQQGNLKIGIQRIRNEWDVKLTQSVPIDLNLNVNASSTEVDLTDIKLDKLNVELNAGSGNIYIKNKNEGKIKSTTLKVNAGDLDIRGLGNLNTETLKIDVNAGSTTIDFNGSMLRDIDVNIESNAASVNLNVPNNIGIRIDRLSGSLKNISGNKKFISKDGMMETENYKDAQVKMVIRVKANISSLNIN